MTRIEHKSENILAKLKENNPLVILLNPRDYSWNPATTRSWECIRGPAEVTYHRSPDGGVKASVAPLPVAVELRDAIVTHYLATGKPAEPQDLATLLSVSESTIRKRMRSLDNDVAGCDVREGTNGRRKTSYTPSKKLLRSLLLQERGRNV